MSPALYIETQGSGPDLVLLHGWGLHGGVWGTLLPRLTADFRVTRVDLPGHGQSRDTPMTADLRQVAQHVLASVPANATWLGCSLGGLVALRAALDAPKQIRALVLANTTPKFVTGTDWTAAMPPEQLREFAGGLAGDYRETLLRFLSLQVRGDESARASLRRLREALFVRGEPDTASLAAGLELLRVSDLRQELDRLSLPCLVIAGGYDRLTPAAAGEALAKGISGARYACIPKSAHASFISHGEDFALLLTAFMGELDEAKRMARGAG